MRQNRDDESAVRVAACQFVHFRYFLARKPRSWASLSLPLPPSLPPFRPEEGRWRGGWASIQDFDRAALMKCSVGTSNSGPRRTTPALLHDSETIVPTKKCLLSPRINWILTLNVSIHEPPH
jgi:hypothetical protein